MKVKPPNDMGIAYHPASNAREHDFRRASVEREPTGDSDQFGVQRDRGVENLGDWAVFLGLLGHSCKISFVEVWHLGAQSKSGPADAKSLTLWLKSDSGLCAELSGRITSPLQLKSQRHGEASGVRGSDQLFRIGALLVLEAGFE